MNIGELEIRNEELEIRNEEVYKLGVIILAYGTLDFAVSMLFRKIAMSWFASFKAKSILVC